MNEPTENVAKIGPSKVTLFPKRDGVNFSAKSVPEQFQTDIIGVDRLQEEIIMPQDTYTKTEIDSKLDKVSSDMQHGFEKVDLKFEHLEQRMANGFKQVDLKFENLENKMTEGFKQVDLKFDNFERRIENLLLTQENKRLEDQARNKKEFMYWAIGIIITLAGIAFPIWFGK